MKYLLKLELTDEGCAAVLQDAAGTAADREEAGVCLSDFDGRLCAYIREAAEHKSGAGAADDEAGEEISRAAAEAAAQLALQLKDGREPGGTRVTVAVNLQEREYPVSLTGRIADEIVTDLVRRVCACAEEVYDRNVNTVVDEIECPGDSLWAFLLRGSLSRLFGEIRVRGGEPSAARGEQPGEAGYSYGVLFAEDYEDDPNRRVILNLIRKGSPLPASGSCVCYAARESHALLYFDIYRSEIPDERYDASEPAKTFIGRVEFRLPPEGRTISEVSCRLELSAQGVLSARVSDGSGSAAEESF